MPDAPLILAFDTSAAFCAAAVVCGPRVLAQAEEPMAKGQAERLMGLCSDLMQEAGVAYDALAGIGVGIGPGNFTGVRISVSAARGMALGLGVPANGVSLLEALAYGAPLPCLTAVDARRGQVYVQGFGQDVCADPQVVDANALPAFEGALIGAGGIDPAHPRAVAIAHLAAARLGTLQPRPAPLYLRAPDAAPARDAAPEILDG